MTTAANSIAKKGAKKAAKQARHGLDDSQKITVLKKDNPHREGTIQFNVFEAIKSSKTVGDFVKTVSKKKLLHDGTRPHAITALRLRMNDGVVKVH
ncbi:MAG TPA: hypothetical protein VF203_07750 [Burkholderiales bacterium]